MANLMTLGDAEPPAGRGRSWRREGAAPPRRRDALAPGHVWFCLKTYYTAPVNKFFFSLVRVADLGVSYTIKTSYCSRLKEQALVSLFSPPPLRLRVFVSEPAQTVSV